MSQQTNLRFLHPFLANWALEFVPVSPPCWSPLLLGTLTATSWSGGWSKCGSASTTSIETLSFIALAKPTNCHMTSLPGGAEELSRLAFPIQAPTASHTHAATPTTNW